jgi:hypothetical protein
MNRKLWIQKTLTVCSMTAILTVFSMVALAGTGAVAGELTVSGTAANGVFVTVNGEPAESGRTISSSSTITTPEGITAVVNFGKLGKIQVGPNTTFSLNADNTSIAGNLTAGSITVLNATNGVSVRTLSGETVTVGVGETATASGTTAKSTTTTAGGNHNWLIFALVATGAMAAIVYAATTGSNNRLGAGATTVSPVR